MSQTIRGGVYRHRARPPSLSRRRGSGHRGSGRRDGHLNRSKSSGSSPVGGMHQRRDRHWPFFGGKSPPVNDGGETGTQPNGPALAVAEPETCVESHAAAVELAQKDSASLQALRLWLRWNQAYEKVTACMFKAGEDRRQVEQLLDQVDQMRFQAVQLSERLTD